MSRASALARNAPSSEAGAASTAMPIGINPGWATPEPSTRSTSCQARTAANNSMAGSPAGWRSGCRARPNAAASAPPINGRRCSRCSWPNDLWHGRRRGIERRRSSVCWAASRARQSLADRTAPVFSAEHTADRLPENTRPGDGNLALAAWALWQRRNGAKASCPIAALTSAWLGRPRLAVSNAWRPGPFPCRWLDDLWADPARPKPSASSFFPRRLRRLLAPASLQKSCPLGSSAAAAARWVRAGRTRPSRSAIAGEWSPGDKQRRL